MLRVEEMQEPPLRRVTGEKRTLKAPHREKYPKLRAGGGKPARRLMTVHGSEEFPSPGGVG